jgi:hypothetical protein
MNTKESLFLGNTGLLQKTPLAQTAILISPWIVWQFGIFLLGLPSFLLFFTQDQKDL